MDYREHVERGRGFVLAPCKKSDAGSFKIGDVVAFLVHTTGAGECIASAMAGNIIVPMIAYDEERYRSLLELAQKAADLQGVSLRAVRFNRGEELAVIRPRGRDGG